MLRAIMGSLVLLLPWPMALAQETGGKEEPKKAEPQESKVQAVGQGLTIQGQLSADDPKDKKNKNSHHKVHLLKMEAGSNYVLELKSFRFDSFLRLEDSTGKALAEDNGNDMGNARISFKPEKTAAFRVIVTSVGPAQTGAYTLAVRALSDGEQKFRTLEAGLKKAIKGLQMEFSKADTEEEKDKIKDKFFELAAEKLAGFHTFAEENTKDPVAREAQRIVDQLLRVVSESASPAVAKHLRAFLGQVKEPQMKVQISVALGQNLGKQYEKAFQKKDQGAALLYAEAEKTLNQAAKQADGLARKGIEDALFELKHLTIGKAAPEIEGEDIEGKKFKLSDYRGKVVVLDFWGHW